MNFDFSNVVAVRPDKKVYRDGGKAIKVFDLSYSKANVLNEALNQARVEETALCIPKVLEVTVLDDGKWAIVYEFIEGETLDALMKNSPKKTDEYLARLADIQIEINAQRCPLLSKLRDKMHAKISSTNLSATTRYDLHTRLEGMPKHNKLCHGDLNPSNVIITKDDKAYIIDWSHATQGNASADASRTCLYFMLQGEKELAEKYMNIFCRKTDTARQYAEKWMPIVAASQSVKGKPEERDLLLSMVDVVDYE